MLIFLKLEMSRLGLSEQEKSIGKIIEEIQDHPRLKDL
jgi:hypothetical protein